MTAASTFDVVVIGAGPAGLAAASAAAQCGASVAVVDGAPTAGGQYGMQRPPSLPPLRLAAMEEARAMIAAVREAGVALLLGTEVWAVVPGWRLFASVADGAIEIAARTLVVATGAYDRVPPFPGWTLPGVVAPGAAQRMAKLGNTPVGRRVVLAGSGAFLPVVAGALRTVGASIVAFVEAQRPTPALLAHLARYPERWAETWALVRALRAATATRRSGWIVTAARGDDRVEQVEIAPLRDGAIDRTRAETIDRIDALVVGFGFRPSIDVTSLLRCEHAYDEAAGGWYCVADPATGRTSVPHVFAAGEVTGVAGATPARWSGMLAGATAAEDAGRGTLPAAQIAEARRELARARSFVAGVNAFFAPPRCIDSLAADDTIVCRCECVTKRDLLAAGADGAHTTLGAKLWTRAGMGACQGRECGWPVARIVAPDDPAAAGYNRPRIPIRPVPLHAVDAACRSIDALEAAP